MFLVCFLVCLFVFSFFCISLSFAHLSTLPLLTDTLQRIEKTKKTHFGELRKASREDRKDVDSVRSSDPVCGCLTFGGVGSFVCWLVGWLVGFLNVYSLLLLPLLLLLIHIFLILLLLLSL
jgi:hypothetical protein